MPVAMIVTCLCGHDVMWWLNGRVWCIKGMLVKWVLLFRVFHCELFFNQITRVWLEGGSNCATVTFVLHGCSAIFAFVQCNWSFLGHQIHFIKGLWIFLYSPLISLVSCSSALPVHVFIYIKVWWLSHGSAWAKVVRQQAEFVAMWRLFCTVKQKLAQ